MIALRGRWALTFGALAIVTIASASPTLAQSKEPFLGLDAYITKAVQTWKIPGMSVAIVRNDSVLYTKGFGVLSVSNPKPVDDQTLFEIGSSSKAFTATLVAMLVTDGKMRWDEHLTTYLPGFKMYDPVANEDLTLRDALTHRSGIARGELAWLGSGVSRDEVLHRVRFLKPESPFRSRYSYQNMMFLAAGEAAGKAAGSTWDDLVKQRIFVPLGMTSTVSSSRGLTTSNVAQGHGMSHDTAFVKPPFNAENIAPAGAILSNAKDMAQWLRFQLNDGQVNGKRLVSTQALKEIHSPQILTSPGAGGGRGGGGDTIPATRFTSYGMGWFVEDYHQQLRWQHGGNTLGMTAAVGMLPEKRLGVAVLSNMQSAALPGIIMDYVMDRELGLPMKDLSNDAYTRALTQRRRADSVEMANAAQHPTDAKPPLPLTAYTGAFADSLYGDVTVAVKDGHLELERGEWHGPLQYWNATNFRWTILPGAPTGPMFIKFEISPDNVVTGLWFGLAGDATLLNRKGGGGRGGRGGRGGTP
jgi:CubicO group peptidase (beta-lactamase class C family)